MTRRESLLTSASLAFGALVTGAVPLEPKLSLVEKLVGDKWEQCRMFSLVKGDHFRIDGSAASYVATEDPRQDSNGDWSILGMCPAGGLTADDTAHWVN